MLSEKFKYEKQEELDRIKARKQRENDLMGEEWRKML